MNIWAIADLHLSFGVPEKTMEIFGPQWASYAQKIEEHWRAEVQEEDIVLIAGDISWAKLLSEALIDLEWIDRLPGTKVAIKGNHDYWWSSLSKVKQVLPKTLHLIQNDAWHQGTIAVGGSRLWDTVEYNFEALYGGMGFTPTLDREQEKIYNREIERLELSLKAIKPEAALRIVMTHYPPIGLDLKSTRVSALLEKYGVSHCVFGHLHNVPQKEPLFGTSRGVAYHLTSCDYLNFKPLKIYSSAK